jgi:putative transposase
MANTNTQKYIQIESAVWGRACPTEQHQSFGRANVTTEIHRNDLEKYICGIISNNKCKPLSLYC